MSPAFAGSILVLVLFSHSLRCGLLICRRLRRLATSHDPLNLFEAKCITSPIKASAECTRLSARCLWEGT